MKKAFIMASLFAFVFLAGCGKPKKPSKYASTETKIKYIIAKKAYDNKSNEDFTSYKDLVFVDLLYYYKQDDLSELAKEIEKKAGICLELDYKNITKDTLLLAITNQLDGFKKLPAVESPVKLVAQKIVAGKSEEIASGLAKMEKQLSNAYSELEKRFATVCSELEQKFADKKQLTQQDKDKITDNQQDKEENQQGKEEPGTMFGSSFQDLKFWMNE